MEVIKTHKAELENKKVIFREIGMIVSLIIVFFVLNLKSGDKQVTGIEFNFQTDVSEEIIPVTVQESKPLPPPPPQQTTKISIVDNDVLDESDIEINAEANQETVITEYIPYVPVEEEEEDIIEEEPIFVVVESMPSFPGGVNELMRYFHKNLNYPVLAKESNIQGKVFVSFVVEKDGSVTDIVILRGIGGGCDEEATRVVQNMPNWIPGRQRNVPVRVRFNLPIKFTLQ